jgi:hypothetical protein
MESVPEGPPRLWAGSAPEIRVDYEPIGRETLTAITDELAAEAALIDLSATPDEMDQPPLGRDTLAAIAEALGAGESSVSSTELSITEPRDAQAGNQPAAEAPAGRRRRRTVGYEEEAGVPPLAPTRAADIEIFEMVSFVVRGADVSQLVSQTGRRLFVAERLSHRLPVQSLAAIERVDVAPWTDKGTFVLRVWCRLSAS